MAIIDVRKRLGQGGRLSLDGGFEAVETYYVSTDDPDTSADIIVSASKGAVSIPAFLTTHPDMPMAVVVAKTPRQIDDSGLYFDVEVEYAQREIDVETLIANPLVRPPRPTWGQEIVEEFQEHDILGNSVRDVFGFDIDAIPVEDVRPILTVVQNQVGFNIQHATSFTGAVNNDEFLGQKYQARVRSITGRQLFESNLFYWEVQYVIVFRRNGWRWPLKHRSFHRRLNDKVVRIMDEGDEDADPPVLPQPVPEPVAIDAAGVPVPPGEPDWWMAYDFASGRNIPLLMPQPGTEARRLFGIRRYPDKPFAQLGIRYG